MSPRTSWVVLSLLLAGLPGCRGKEERAGSPRQSPSIFGTTLAGEAADLARFSDRVVLLNLWATWCKPCRDELPALRQLHERRSASAFTVLGVSVDAAKDEPKVRAMVEQYGLPYPVVLDPQARTPDAFDVVGFPTSILLDRHRNVIWRRDGLLTADDPDLAMVLDSALATPTGP